MSIEDHIPPRLAEANEAFKKLLKDREVAAGTTVREGNIRVFLNSADQPLAVFKDGKMVWSA